MRFLRSSTARLSATRAKKPYLRLNTAISNVPVATLPAGSVANADAFGVAPTNRKARPSLGPVNDKNGLLLMLK